MPSNLTTIEEVMTEARHFHNVVQGKPLDYQVTQEQADMLDDLATAAENALAQRTTDENALTLSRALFKAAFEALEKFFRPLRQSVKDNPSTSDADRAELHLTTGGGEESTGDPLESAPLVFVEHAGVHHHLIRFFMPGEQSGSTKKPKGALGCKIRCKIDGAATTDLKDYQLITMDTKSPYIYEHDAADAGKTAHYICLWTTDGENDSPQSEAFSLVIT